MDKIRYALEYYPCCCLFVIYVVPLTLYTLLRKKP